MLGYVLFGCVLFGYVLGYALGYVLGYIGIRFGRYSDILWDILENIWDMLGYDLFGYVSGYIRIY